MSVPSNPVPPAQSTGTISIAPRDSDTPSATFVLLAVDGADRGARWVIDATSPSRILLGKSPTCDIRLADPAVSRRHASLHVSRSRLRLTDLGSTNGTFVNGIMIGDAWLDGGEFVRVGETSFHVQAGEARGPVPLSQRTSFGQVVGGSEPMRRLYPLCEKLAASDVPVVIEGETGTGKEVLAESLHAMWRRADGPFVVFDCVAAPPTLLETLLFGYEKGAFTGAATSRAGVFERAHSGTLLIDEIGDLDIGLQPKLLRVIQTREVQRVGRSGATKVDVRVIAVTRRDLDREVQAGRFRDDLFFRLNVARIELPPLRERRGDVTLLARHFWEQLGGAGRPIPPELLQRCEDYAWPGNVRELQNLVARHLALGELADLETLMPPSAVRDPLVAAFEGSQAAPGRDDCGSAPDFVDEIIARNLVLSDARERVLDVFERRYVEHMLRVHRGNVTRAAAAAGLARRYFHVLRTKRVRGGVP
jgi:DNA-binding NtrC family response regulator